MSDDRSTTVSSPVDTRADASTAYRVEMLDIVKSYGSNLANDHVTFTLRRGEVHALLGENGAGKTTLMSILYGLVLADSGEIRIDGERALIHSPNDAMRLGIGMVHQAFMLVPSFTVAENVALGSASHGSRFNRSEIEEAVMACAARYGIDIDPRAVVDELPVDMKQRVEILRLLYRGAETLILDEPTSVLGPVETNALLDTLDSLRDGGSSIVIVTHKLREVMALADRVSVLRRGKNVMTATRGSYDEASLARAMVPEELSSLPSRTLVADAKTKPVLRVQDLTVHSDIGTAAIDELNLEVFAGEIVGIAGVAGNGQQELLEALAGTREPRGGRIMVGDEDLTYAGPRKVRGAGVAIIPSDRSAWAVAPTMTVAENLLMTRVCSRRDGEGRPPRSDESSRQLADLVAEFDIRPSEPTLPMSALSGGNQQKVVLARELLSEPRLVIVANPTQGLDVGATALVHRKLIEARNRGTGVLLISPDIDELIAVSDRLAVLYRGCIVLECKAESENIERIGLAIAGSLTGDEGGKATSV